MPKSRTAAGRHQHACASASTTPPSTAVEERLRLDPKSTASLGYFLGSATVVAVLAYLLHPFLVQRAIDAFGLQASGDGMLNFTKKDITVFETSFFGFLSFLFATLIGTTFGVLYARQTAIVQELYGEVLALELLLIECQQRVADPAERKAIVSIFSLYVDEEIGDVSGNYASPFSDKSSAMRRLLDKSGEWRDQGVNVDGIVALAKDLIEKQSQRIAANVHILSPLHWVMLSTVGVLFVACFIIFETGTKASALTLAEDQLIFAAVSGLSFAILLALLDLSNAESGTYSFRAALDRRLSFVRSELSSWDITVKEPEDIPMSVTSK